MKPKVFISAGTACTQVHSDGSEAISRTLEAAGLSPRQMEKNEWSSEQPLRAIKGVMEQCDGTVVIAFSRYEFPSGLERRKDGKQKSMNDVRMPTVWNQIEATMGYMRGHPLLVIAEHGLHEDGLLEGRYDWKVFWTDFSQEHLRSEAFVGFLDSWRRLVDQSIAARSKASIELDVSKMTIPQLFARLSVGHVWGVVSAFFGLLMGVATVAFRAGAGKWPWQ
jgi:hypothetical protein